MCTFIIDFTSLVPWMSCRMLFLLLRRPPVYSCHTHVAVCRHRAARTVAWRVYLVFSCWEKTQRSLILPFLTFLAVAFSWGCIQLFKNVPEAPPTSWPCVLGYLATLRPEYSAAAATAWAKSASVKKDPSDELTALDLPEETLSSSEADPHPLIMEPVTELSRSPMLDAGVCSSPRSSNLRGCIWGWWGCVWGWVWW